MSYFDSIIYTLKTKHIRALTVDARLTNQHTAFIALPGSQHHGLHFIGQAISQGATYIVVDADDPYLSQVTCTPLSLIKIPGLIQNLGYFAAEFYGNPSQKLSIHAVTGTNGKTSTSQFIAQALSLLSKPCGVIGTLGIGIYPNLKPNPNTTPEAVQLQDFLDACAAQNITDISMEASSIALAAGRMQDCQLETALFTNLTQDHLDYHHTMQAYGEAKQKLFEFPGLKHAIINIDDTFGQHLLHTFKDKLNCTAFSMNPNINIYGSHVVARQYQLTSRGIEAVIEINQQPITIHSSLLGAFNLSNLLAVIGWLTTQHVSPADIANIITKIQAIPGRMQHIYVEGKPIVIVDFCHTPDALAQALQALRTHCAGKLWCVFGCGGNRDKTKRPLMGAAAASLSDRVIITNDNSRFEDPQDIANQILSGIKNQQHVIVELDRAEAIQYAITQANPNDIILLAGKGHESYQDIQGIKHDFNDTEIAKKILIHNF